ncbi:MAG: hypothetical protein KKD11_01075, partial [Candidatus Omnitrophica bacterium]|nr:hypothetical protein [Candidatus Omnitrophota bacterium]
MNRPKRILFLIFIFLLIPCATAYTVTLLNVTPKKLNMGIVESDDYSNGYKEKLRGNIIKLKNSANDWKLMLKTNDSDMGMAGNYAKSINDFHWKATGEYATQATYQEITNYDVEVARGQKSFVMNTIP